MPTHPTHQVYDKLLPGQEYSFSVLAWNGVGRGPVSDQSEIFKTMTSVPEPPETPECSGPTQTAMTLSWTEPYDNGEPIVGYIIARRAGSIGDFGHEVYQTKEQLWSMWSQWEAYETAAQEDKGETALEIDDTKVESSADGRGKAAKMTTVRSLSARIVVVFKQMSLTPCPAQYRSAEHHRRHNCASRRIGVEVEFPGHRSSREEPVPV